MNLWLDYFRIEYALHIQSGTQDTVAVLNLSYTHRSRSYARHRKETQLQRWYYYLQYSYLSTDTITLTISMPASHCYFVNEFQCPSIALKGDDSTNLLAPVNCTTSIHGDPWHN